MNDGKKQGDDDAQQQPSLSENTERAVSASAEELEGWLQVYAGPRRTFLALDWLRQHPSQGFDIVTAAGWPFSPSVLNPYGAASPFNPFHPKFPTPNDFIPRGLGLGPVMK